MEAFRPHTARSCIINQLLFVEFVEMFPCPKCLRLGTIKLSKLSEKYAPTIHAAFKCGACLRLMVFNGSGFVENNLNKRGRKTVTIRRRLASACSIATINHARLRLFFASMDLPCPTNKTFNNDLRIHYKICLDRAKISREFFLKLVADRDGVIPVVAADEQWTVPRNAQACMGTFTAPLPSDPKRTVIIASAMTMRNNVDTVSRDASGTFTVPIRGDQDYYGSSNGMAAAVMYKLVDTIKAANCWIRTLVTDGDAKSFKILDEQRGALPDGSRVNNQRDPGHRTKNIKKLLLKESKENNLLAPFVLSFVRGYQQILRINACEKGGVDGLKSLVTNLFEHVYFDRHKMCSIGCQRRFRDIYLPIMQQRYVEFHTSFGAFKAGDIVEVQWPNDSNGDAKVILLSRETEEHDIGFPRKLFYRLWQIVHKNVSIRQKLDELISNNEYLAKESENQNIEIADLITSITIQEAISDEDEHEDDDGVIYVELDDDDDEHMEAGYEEQQALLRVLDMGNGGDLYVENPLGIIAKDDDEAAKVITETTNVSVICNAMQIKACVRKLEVDLPRLFAYRLDDSPTANLKCKAAVNKVESLKKNALSDLHLYADGYNTTQVESIHHVRRKYIGDKNVHYLHLSPRVAQADLQWNHGPKYAVEVLAAQHHFLSDIGKNEFNDIALEQEHRRQYNLTEERKQYLRQRDKFIKARMSTEQKLDDYGYFGDANADKEDNKGKRKRSEVPEDERCDFVIIQTGQRCSRRQARLIKKKKKRDEVNVAESTLIEHTYCTIHAKSTQ